MRENCQNSTMIFFILLIIAAASGLLSNSRMLGRLPELRRHQPVPDIRIGLNAMKNFALFAGILALLYWVQVQFGDAEVWIKAFQR